MQTVVARPAGFNRLELWRMERLIASSSMLDSRPFDEWFEAVSGRFFVRRRVWRDPAAPEIHVEEGDLIQIQPLFVAVKAECLQPARSTMET